MLHARLLLYFDEVSRSGSIRKAGHKLGVAPSAISRQIQTLEGFLGVELLQRTNRRLSLTAAGEVLILHIRATLADYDRTLGRIAEVRGLRRGEIRLVMMAGLAANLVPMATARFRKRHPGVELRLQILPTAEAILEALAAGLADLGVGFDLPKRLGVSLAASIPGALGGVMAPDHPLAAQAQLKLAQCLDHDLVLADAGMAIRPHLDVVFATLAQRPRIAVETNSIEVMRQLAVEGEALTFLTPFDIDQEIKRGTLVWRPVQELGNHSQELMILTSDLSAAPALGSLFVETLREGLGLSSAPALVTTKGPEA